MSLLQITVTHKNNQPYNKTIWLNSEFIEEIVPSSTGSIILYNKDLYNSSSSVSSILSTDLFYCTVTKANGNPVISSVYAFNTRRLLVSEDSYIMLFKPYSTSEYVNYTISGSISLYVPTVPPNWGDILGTLSNQTDLQLALNGKQDTLGFTPLTQSQILARTFAKC